MSEQKLLITLVLWYAENNKFPVPFTTTTEHVGAFVQAIRDPIVMEEIRNRNPELEEDITYDEEKGKFRVKFSMHPDLHRLFTFVDFYQNGSGQASFYHGEVGRALGILLEKIFWISDPPRISGLFQFEAEEYTLDGVDVPIPGDHEFHGGVRHTFYNDVLQYEWWGGI